MTVRHSVLDYHLISNPPQISCLSHRHEDWSNDYPILLKYKDTFEDIVPKWCVSPLCAYDTKNHFMKTDELESSLKGSLVHVYFQLRHYAIKSKRTDGIAGNTFSAILTQVKVLERGSEQCRSPYRSMLLKGPTIH